MPESEAYHYMDCGVAGGLPHDPSACEGLAYDRNVLVEILVYHWRDGIKGCGCGWAELGKSWPRHVATVYEESVAAGLLEGPADPPISQ